MKKLGMAIWLAAGAMLVAAPAFPQNQGQGRAIVTVLPSHAGEAAAGFSLQDVKIKVSGRPSSVTNVTALRGAENPLELVVLIDGSAHSSLGLQLGVIRNFVQEMPSNARMAIAYMANGSAVLTGPLSADPAAVLRGLRVPGGTAGSNGSPYFCLSDLAKNWPSKDLSARREVVMITDGVDEYQEQYDPSDPYVQTAIKDSVRAGLVVYAMYWTNRGGAGESMYASNAGQNLLMEITDATGGGSYWQGTGNPVSLDSFFADLRRRLENQYLVSFVSRLDGKPEVQTLKLQASVPGKVTAPRMVFVNRAEAIAQ